MSSTLSVSHPPSFFEVGSSHCHNKEKPSSNLFMNVLEKISAIALGIFSAFTSLELFIPFFFVGVCIGFYSYMQEKESCEHSHPVSSCANGFLEQLTGVKLPPIISLAANIAVTICHIDHHATVFVPVVGISVGTWIGKTITPFNGFTRTFFH